jgi:membrane-associated phospholipid phosphatase
MVLRKKHCAVFLILLLAPDAMSQSARPPDSSPWPEAPSSVAIVPNDSVSEARKPDPERDWLPPGTDPENKLGFTFVKHLAGDQKRFWTSARDLDRGGARTFLPFMGFTGLLFASDGWLSKQVPDKPNQLSRSNTVSDLGVFSLMGAAGGAFVWGHVTKNDHLREAGLLSFETVLNSTAVAYALKSAVQRQRPLGDANRNTFATGSSFPSGHAVVAWSIAGVMAHEYPSPWSQFLSYGLASAVSLTRVTSRNHFPSDAVVGSALGWYLGRQIYRAHHDTTLGGGPWGALVESTTKKSRTPESMGSPYVPIDHWVYPVFDRLAALGFVHSGYAGMRPWTRIACAELLEEAGERLRYGGQEGSEASRLYDTLVGEFSDELRGLDGGNNPGASIDSVYTRFTGISGQPLRDGYHFGQTIINDYGRPYGEGFNAISGITAHAVAGPFSLYVQGEYQHAPAVASDPPGVLQATANQDLVNPLPNGTPSIDRFRLMTASAAVMFKGFQFSFGKQSLWLGPGDSGPFLFSDNAEPIPMLRIDQVFPSRIPGLSKILGPMRAEFFLGQLSGHRFVFSDGAIVGPDVDPQPFIHGSKISFKPTPHLEFGMGVTSVFGGPGLPFTWRNFLRTFTSNAPNGDPTDPGDRRSTFEFSYQVPYLRDWLTIYADSIVEDEISPLGSTRPSMRMGFYMPRIPKVPRLDLRMEGLYSDVPGYDITGGIYFNARYRSGYTNDRNLIASWIGRAGRGGQAWATYWFSPRRKLQFSYRHMEVDRVFLQGGHLSDVSIRPEVMIGRHLSLSGFLQYENWGFPLLAPQAKSNLTGSFQVTFFPRWKSR